MIDASNAPNISILQDHPDYADIFELCEPEYIREAFPLMRELRAHLTEGEFVDRVAAMRQANGYRLFALRVEAEIVALAGVAVQENLYQGRHLWLYDLVTSSRHRSRGHGRRLLAFVEAFARDSGCKAVALVSGVQRTEAHRFYEKYMGYEKPCYLFEKTLG